jgi:hypothetical protein
VYSTPLLLTFSGMMTFPEISVDVAFTETVPVVPLSVNTVYVSSPISKVSLTAADTLANVANANNNK